MEGRIYPESHGRGMIKGTAVAVASMLALITISIFGMSMGKPTLLLISSYALVLSTASLFVDNKTLSSMVVPFTFIYTMVFIDDVFNDMAKAIFHAPTMIFSLYILFSERKTDWRVSLLSAILYGLIIFQIKQWIEIEYYTCIMGICNNDILQCSLIIIASGVVTPIIKVVADRRLRPDSKVDRLVDTAIFATCYVAAFFFIASIVYWLWEPFNTSFIFLGVAFALKHWNKIKKFKIELFLSIAFLVINASLIGFYPSGIWYDLLGFRNLFSHFSMAFIISFLLLASGKKYYWLWAFVAMLAYEAFEAIFGIIGIPSLSWGLQDTIIDVAMNAIGIVVFSFISWGAGKRESC